MVEKTPQRDSPKNEGKSEYNSGDVSMAELFAVPDMASLDEGVGLKEPASDLLAALDAVVDDAEASVPVETKEHPVETPELTRGLGTTRGIGRIQSGQEGNQRDKVIDPTVRHPFTTDISDLLNLPSINDAPEMPGIASGPSLEMKDTIDKHESTISNLQKRLASTNQALDMMQKDLSQAQEAGAESQSQVEILTSKITQYEERVRDSQAAIDLLQETMGQLQAAFAERQALAKQAESLLKMLPLDKSGQFQFATDEQRNALMFYYISVVRNFLYSGGGAELEAFEKRFIKAMGQSS